MPKSGAFKTHSGVIRVSIFGINSLVLCKYHAFGYLAPQGGCINVDALSEGGEGYSRACMPHKNGGFPLDGFTSILKH